MSEKNVSLNEMMDKTPRSKSAEPVDLTQGYVSPDKTEEKPLKKVAMPVTAGPLNSDSITTLDASDILPKRQKTNDMEESLFADLDAAVDRECESITERVEAIREAQREEVEMKEAEVEAEAQKKADAESVAQSIDFSNSDDEDFGLYDDDDDNASVEPAITSHISAMKANTHSDEILEPITTNTHEVKDSIKPSDIAEEEKEPIVARIITTEKTNILDGVNDDDLFGDDDELAENETSDSDKNSETMLEELKKEVKEKITLTKNALDLSKFTISKKSVNAQKAMKLAAQTRQSVADWTLLSAKRPISMTGLSGPEILKLNPENSSRNRLNTFRDMYRVIYEHVYDANKPEFETWLKQTRFVDLQHVYFALYMATFGGSNFVNYSCPHCNKVFIKDIKFEDMVVYADDETRQKVRDILKMDTTSPSNDEYPVDLFQISDSYAFGLRTPSIWNVIIETASLSDKFLERHADLIDIVSYIDGIYIIDKENGTLIPIDTKPDHNDQAKTSARRIKAYYDIISCLSSEDYYQLRSYISSYDEDAGKLNYQIPACTCPDCATEIPANTDITPDNMLFIRHQLAAIGNM